MPDSAALSPADLHEKLRDPGSSPAFDSACWPDCPAERADPRFPLSGKFLRLSHWPLFADMNIDRRLVDQELRSLSRASWSAFDNDPLKERGGGLSPYWRGKFLRNFVPQSAGGFGRPKPVLRQLGSGAGFDGYSDRSLLVNTEIWEALPYIRSIAEKIVTVEKSGRILLSRVAPHGRVNWHCHSKDTRCYSYFYAHAPLQTGPEASMLVLRGGGAEHEHYPAGSAWVFNTQQNHAVSCRGLTRARTHLTIIAHLDDKKFTAALERSLKKHRGYRPRKLAFDGRVFLRPGRHAPARIEPPADKSGGQNSRQKSHV